MNLKIFCLPLLLLLLSLSQCTNAWKVETNPNLKEKWTVNTTQLSVDIKVSDIPQNVMNVIKFSQNQAELGYCLISPPSNNIECFGENFTLKSKSNKELIVQVQLNEKYFPSNLKIFTPDGYIYDEKIDIHFDIQLKFINEPSELTTGQIGNIICKSNIPGKSLKDGKLFPYIYSTKGITINQDINGDASTSTATFMVNSFNDSSTIYCKFGNDHVIKKEFMIKYPPRITGFRMSSGKEMECDSGRPITVEDGEKIQCLYNSYPLPHNVTWRTDKGKIVADNDYVTLLHDKSTSSQDIACTVVNVIDGINNQHTKYCNVHVEPHKPSFIHKITDNKSILVVIIVVSVIFGACIIIQIGNCCYKYQKRRSTRKVAPMEMQYPPQETVKVDINSYVHENYSVAFAQPCEV